MHDLTYLEAFVGSVEEGIERVNQLYWHLSVKQHEQAWFVLAGEVVIYRTDSHESLDAFLYGLAMAYSVVPEELFQQLRVGMSEFAGET